jgi:hypothetical protein
MEICREVKAHLHLFSAAAVYRSEYSSFTFQPLYPQRKSPQNPLNMKLGSMLGREKSLAPGEHSTIAYRFASR